MICEHVPVSSSLPPPEGERPASTFGSRIGEQVVAGLLVAFALALISWIMPPAQTGLSRIVSCGGTGLGIWQCPGHGITSIYVFSWLFAWAPWITDGISDKLEKKWYEQMGIEPPSAGDWRKREQYNQGYYGSSVERKMSPRWRNEQTAGNWSTVITGAALLAYLLILAALPADFYAG